MTDKTEEGTQQKEVSVQREKHKAKRASNEVFIESRKVQVGKGHQFKTNTAQYLLWITDQIEKEGNVILKARGQAISRAFDLAFNKRFDGVAVVTNIVGSHEEIVRNKGKKEIKQRVSAVEIQMKKA